MRSTVYNEWEAPYQNTHGPNRRPTFEMGATAKPDVSPPLKPPEGRKPGCEAMGEVVGRAIREPGGHCV